MRFNLWPFSLQPSLYTNQARSRPLSEKQWVPNWPGTMFSNTALPPHMPPCMNECEVRGRTRKDFRWNGSLSLSLLPVGHLVSQWPIQEAGRGYSSLIQLDSTLLLHHLALPKGDSTVGDGWIHTHTHKAQFHITVFMSVHCTAAPHTDWFQYLVFLGSILGAWGQGNIFARPQSECRSWCCSPKGGKRKREKAVILWCAVQYL